MDKYRLVTRKPRDILFEDDGRAYFIYKAEKRYMDDIIRTHDNPWINAIFPPYIHGILTFNTIGKNLYVQIVGDQIRVWEK